MLDGPGRSSGYLAPQGMLQGCTVLDSGRDILHRPARVAPGVRPRPGNAYLAPQGMPHGPGAHRDTLPLEVCDTLAACSVPDGGAVRRRASAPDPPNAYLAPRGMLLRPACFLPGEWCRLPSSTLHRVPQSIPCPSRYAARCQAVPSQRARAARRDTLPLEVCHRRPGCLPLSGGTKKPRRDVGVGDNRTERAPTSSRGAVLSHGLMKGLRRRADSPAFRTAGRASRGTSSRETQSHLLNTALAQARGVCRWAGARKNPDGTSGSVTTVRREHPRRVGVRSCLTDS